MSTPSDQPTDTPATPPTPATTATPATTPTPAPTSVRSSGPAKAAHPSRRRNDVRRNAWLASAIAVPVTVVLAFALAPSPKKASGPSTAAVTAAGPTVDAAAAADCNKLLVALPTELGGLAPRRVVTTPESPYVLAWGDPALVLTCGVARPKDLVVNSSVQAFLVSGIKAPTTGVYWLESKVGTTEVFTAIDRSVYISLASPLGATVQPLPLLSDAIDSVLPAVCVGGVSVTSDNPEQLCTHRT